jgi:hypothetical protein
MNLLPVEFISFILPFAYKVAAMASAKPVKRLSMR